MGSLVLPMKLTEGKVTHRYTFELVLNNGTSEKEFLRQDLRARIPLFNTAPIVDEDKKARSIILPRQQQGLSRCSFAFQAIATPAWGTGAPGMRL